jgi:zinc protease
MGFLLDHVDQLTFAGQRDVVKNERRQHYDNAPYGMVPQYLHEAVYPVGHAYHDLTIGTPHDLDAATLADVQTFFRTWYVPNNASLVIAGDIDKGATKALVAKYFGPIPKGSPPDRPGQASPPTVVLSGDQRVVVEAGVELPRVYIAWPTPRALTAEDGRLDLVARILASGKTSRLYKRLVYDMQIAQDVSANQESHMLGSLFGIVATAQRGHTADELRAAIDLELATLRAGGVHDDELARAKTAIVSEMVFELERDASRAERVNYYAQDAGDPDFLRKDAARYQTATADEVADAVRTYLPEGRRVVVNVTPTKGAPIAGRRKDAP